MDDSHRWIEETNYWATKDTRRHSDCHPVPETSGPPQSVVRRYTHSRVRLSRAFIITEGASVRVCMINCSPSRFFRMTLPRGERHDNVGYRFKSSARRIKWRARRGTKNAVLSDRGTADENSLRMTRALVMFFDSGSSIGIYYASSN